MRWIQAIKQIALWVSQRADNKAFSKFVDRRLISNRQKILQLLKL